MGKSSQRFQRAASERTNTYSMATRGPISFPSLAIARQHLKTPVDANYVMWNPAWPTGRDLEDVFATELGANDILVLPERVEPYIIDSSEGFRAAGVQSVTGRYGQLPIINRYKGVRTARTWFAMARCRRGILGMGPGAIIKLSQSSWTQEPQIEDKNSVHADGWVSPGRYYTDTNDTLRNELVGCQEKIIESAHTNPYYGNFTMRAHDLGGVAYSGLTNAAGGNYLKTAEHLDVSNSWRGFSGVPNGEAGGIAFSGGSYYIGYCLLGTRDSSGARVGTSPIMINSSNGGTIEELDAGEAYRGMMTIWNSTGKHIINNVNARFNMKAAGINLEKCQAGFELEWTGGSIWSDYNGKGGKTPRPADQPGNGAGGGGLHIGLYSEVGSSKITLRGVDLDTGPTVGHLNVQSYGASQQNVNDIKCYYANGTSVPVKAYGLN